MCSWLTTVSAFRSDTFGQSVRWTFILAWKGICSRECQRVEGLVTSDRGKVSVDPFWDESCAVDYRHRMS